MKAASTPDAKLRHVAAGIAIAGVLVCTVAGAAAYEIWPISIDPPAEFQGPIRQQKEGADIVAWTHKQPDGTATLLQVTTYHLAAMLPKMSEEDSYGGAKQYLGEMLGGIERRRTEFHQSEYVRIKLAGRPAARISWTGIMDNRPTNGVMYCVIVGSYMVNLHTQGSGSTPSASMKMAMQSIDAIRAVLSASSG